MRLSILIVFGSAVACTCASPSPDGAAVTTTPGKGATVERAAMGPPLASKEFYRLDLASEPDCKVGAACDVTLVLTALQGHKVNAEYPTKFVAEASANFGVDGNGSFKIESATRGVMSIKVTPTQAGTFTLDGQFRLSVCTDDSCEIEGPKIALSIRAT